MISVKAMTKEQVREQENSIIKRANGLHEVSQLPMGEMYNTHFRNSNRIQGKVARVSTPSYLPK